MAGGMETSNLKGKLENHSGFTTMKYREAEGLVKRTIDYMFILENKWFQKGGASVIQKLEI